MSRRRIEIEAPQKDNRKLISVPDEHPDTAYSRIPPPDAFEGEADFIQSKDLEAIAVMQIDHYEAEFAHLRKVRLGYAWKRAGGASQGSNTLGKCVKSSGLVKFFSDTDFIIWLAADHLREMDATFWQVEAIVFHELKHAQVDDAGKPSLRGHDFEGFAREINEYGAWDESAEMLRIAFKQLSFDWDIVPRFEDIPEPEPPVGPQQLDFP